MASYLKRISDDLLAIYHRAEMMTPDGPALISGDDLAKLKERADHLERFAADYVAALDGLSDSPPAND